MTELDLGRLRVVPAAPGNWPDLADFFANIPCSCQYWRLSASEYGRRGKEEVDSWQARWQAALRNQLDGETPPGMLAYLEDELVGWCGFGPRPQMERLVRSRTIPRLDDAAVWSVVCFIVKVGYRRQGIADRLLAGVVECARDYGAPGLEAYPVDPQGTRISTTAMFTRAGFERVLMTDSTSAKLPRWLMRLDFD